MVLAPIFYLVFSQLAIGGFALLLLVPKGLVGRGFFRLMGIIYLLAVIFARCANLPISGKAVSWRNFFLAWDGQDVIYTIVMCIIFLCYTISLWLKNEVLNRGLLFAGAVIGSIWIVSSAQSFLPQSTLPAGRFLLPLQFVVSAVLLGAVNSGMWFGHWYLVTPDLPVVHLKRFNQVFLIALLLSTSLSVLNFLFNTESAAGPPQNFFLQVVLGMRVLIGFCGSFLLYAIVWHCLRDNAVEQDAVGATRAATGFLYVAMITVFIGEFCGRFLFLETRYFM
ncbi:MAG: hypothetical protein OXN17_20985 [Candidatus Poribacteria bacterium]|nr:hypothetical protein [Candidatus Poribacteria bacterium]MDE0505130.1 hypothetical protein [Candidatus Poribacteria bacterium]